LLWPPTPGKQHYDPGTILNAISSYRVHEYSRFYRRRYSSTTDRY